MIKEIINNIFSAYVENLLDDINHLALVEEWKLNLNSAAHEKQIDFKVNIPSDKNKLIIMIENSTGQ